VRPPAAGEACGIAPAPEAQLSELALLPGLSSLGHPRAAAPPGAAWSVCASGRSSV